MNELKKLLHLQWHQLRQHHDQRILNGINLRRLHVARRNQKANRNLLVSKAPQNMWSVPLSHWQKWSNCDGQAQILAHLFSLDFFQALQLRGLKQGDVHRLVNPPTLWPNGVFGVNPQQLHCKLTKCLKHPLKELSHVDIVELNPFTQVQGI